MAEKSERWVFTDSELANPAECKSYDEFCASLTGHEMGVMVERNGAPTNHWADGTRGVPQDAKDEADGEDTLYDEASDCYADNWRDVVTNDEGDFVRFA